MNELRRVFLGPTRHVRLWASVQWMLFCIEVIFLFALLAEAYLVPFMPPPWGKLPSEAEAALLSGVSAVLSGLIALKLSKGGTWSFPQLLKTIPSVTYLTVFVVTAPQIIAEWVRLQQHP